MQCRKTLISFNSLSDIRVYFIECNENNENNNNKHIQSSKILSFCSMRNLIYIHHLFSRTHYDRQKIFARIKTWRKSSTRVMTSKKSLSYFLFYGIKKIKKARPGITTRNGLHVTQMEIILLSVSLSSVHNRTASFPGIIPATIRV